MPYNTEQVSLTGSFVPTTTILETSHIYETDVNSPDFKELIVRLYQNLNLMAQVLNTKNTSLYLTQEINDSALWFGLVSNNQGDLRSRFRLVVNVGALGAGVTTVAHGLTIGSGWIFTTISGAASLYNATPANSRYYPVPAPAIDIYVTGTDVVINNTSGVAFATCYVVLEYIKG